LSAVKQRSDHDDAQHVHGEGDHPEEGVPIEYADHLQKDDEGHQGEHLGWLVTIVFTWHKAHFCDFCELGNGNKNSQLPILSLGMGMKTLIPTFGKGPETKKAMEDFNHSQKPLKPTFFIRSQKEEPKEPKDWFGMLWKISTILKSH